VQGASLALVESGAMQLWPLCHILQGVTWSCVYSGRNEHAFAVRTSAVFSGHSCKLFEVMVVLLDKGGGPQLCGSAASTECFVVWSARGCGCQCLGTAIACAAACAHHMS